MLGLKPGFQDKGSKAFGSCLVSRRFMVSVGIECNLFVLRIIVLNSAFSSRIVEGTMVVKTITHKLIFMDRYLNLNQRIFIQCVKQYISY